MSGDADDGVRPSPVLPRRGGRGPVRLRPRRAARVRARAAAGLSHVLYAKSPGGAIATALRVGALPPAGRGRRGRPRPGHRSRRSSSSRARAAPTRMAGGHRGRGRPDADPRRDRPTCSACASTSRASRTAHARIDRDARRGDERRAARSAPQRRRVDERYDPPKALAATARYLDFAKAELGGGERTSPSPRTTWASATCRACCAAFGADDDTPYAEVFFDSSPLRHPEAWRGSPGWATTPPRTCGGSTRRGRSCGCTATTPASSRASRRCTRNKNSAEEVLHPPRPTTEIFAEPESIETALDDGELVTLPADGLRAAGVRIDRRMGELAERQNVDARSTAALRPEALALLVYLAPRRQGDLAGASRSSLTSTVRDEGYQRAAHAHATPRRRTATRCTPPAGRSTSSAATLARAGARLPVHARPPRGAQPHRLGARARRDPRHRRRASGRRRCSHPRPRGRGLSPAASDRAAAVGRDPEAPQHLGPGRRRAEAVDRHVGLRVAAPIRATRPPRPTPSARPGGQHRLRGRPRPARSKSSQLGIETTRAPTPSAAERLGAPRPRPMTSPPVATIAASSPRSRSSVRAAGQARAAALEHRQVLPRQRHQRRALDLLEDHAPRLGGLVRRRRGAARSGPGSRAAP